MNHRDAEMQRKAREAEGISGFLAFDFLCASVSLWLTGFYGFLKIPNQANSMQEKFIGSTESTL
jgi:hypothetical protein